MKTVMESHLEWLKGRMYITPQMEKALIEEEKEQMKDAALFDCTERPNFRQLFVDGFEKYYNKKYKTVST